MSESTTERDVIVDGVSVRVSDGGGGTGAATTTPIVLLHGFLVSRIEWDDVAPLLRRRHRVIAIDLPGFGESGRPPDFAYDRQAYAALVARLIQTLGLGRAHVVGHSYGGSVAIVLAGNHPAVVDRLALIDPICYPFPAPLTGKITLLPIIGGFVFKKVMGRALFYDYFERQVFSGRPLVRPERVETYWQAFRSPEARDRAYRVLPDTVSTEVVAAAIPRIRAPTHIVWGADDRILPVRLADRLAREIAGSKLTILSGCGHAPNEERPEETARILLEHFAGGAA